MFLLSGISSPKKMTSKDRMNHNSLVSLKHVLHCRAIFITALFTRANRWKQPKCPSTEDKRYTVYAYNGIPTSLRKEIPTHVAT